MNSEVLIFHCSQPLIDADGMMILNEKGKVLKKSLTHTLVFEKLKDDTLVLGWAQAHKCDSYSKKVGREIAQNRLTLLKNRINDFPDRKIHKLETVSDDHLPGHVLSNSFDYYLNRAVSKFLNIDDINTVYLVFRSTNQDETVCEIAVQADDIRDSIAANSANSLATVKVNSEMDSEYIFCTYKEDDIVNIVIQNRKDFYDNGLNTELHIDGVATLIDNMTEANTSFTNVEKLTQVTSDVREYDTVLAVRDFGISYDVNLEREFINDED